MGTLHFTFYGCRRQQFAVNGMSSSEMVSAVRMINEVQNIGKTPQCNFMRLLPTFLMPSTHRSLSYWRQRKREKFGETDKDIRVASCFYFS